MFNELVKAMKEHAAKHALVYAVAMGMGLQGFFTGFYDNFWPIEPENMAKLGWWQVVAAVFKSLSFAMGIVVGYLINRPQAGPDSKTVHTSTIATTITDEKKP